MKNKINIIRICMFPVQFILSCISGLASYYFLKSEIQFFLPEISVKLIEIASFSIVFSMELLIVILLYYGVKLLKFQETVKISVLLLVVCVPLFAINFLFTSSGSELLVETKQNKTEIINKTYADTLHKSINKIDNQIVNYEKMLFRNDSISKNYFNFKLAEKNSTIASKNIDSLKKERTKIETQIKTSQKEILIENKKMVEKSKTKYFVFSIALIILIVFFNTISAILANFSENIKEPQKVEKQTISSEISETENTEKQTNETNENQLISDKNSEFQYLEKYNLNGDTEKVHQIINGTDDVETKIKKLLVVEKLQQKYIAELLNVSAAKISRVKNG